MRPPRRGGAGMLIGATLVLVGGGALAAGAWYVTRNHVKPVVTVNATNAPPPVDLAFATAQPGDTSSLAPLSASGASSSPHPIIQSNAMAMSTATSTSLNVAPPVTTASPALNGMTTAQLMGQMTKAHMAGDGRTCLDAYDKLRAQPDFSDPTNGYSMIHGDCLMAAGRCDEGRKIIREYFTQPHPITQQMSPQQVEQTVSSMAQTYCPPTQLAPGERVQRAQMLLYRAQSSKDTATAARYADEMAAQLPQLPRTSEDERRKIIGYEYAIAKAYGDAGRCDEARRHFRNECSMSSPNASDACANSLLNNTSGCKQAP